MFELFKKLFHSKHIEDDSSIHKIIHSHSEDWDFPFNRLPKQNPTRGIEDYLRENPEKEKLFFSKLNSEAEFLEKKKLRVGLNPQVSLAIVAILLFGIGVFLYSRKEKQSIQTASQTEPKPNILLIQENSPRQWNLKDLQNGQTIITENISFKLELIYEPNVQFTLANQTKIILQELPHTTNNISIFLEKGELGIQTQKGNKPNIFWNTQKFIYIPLGTIATLKVDENSEVLEVKEGAFLRKDKQSGTEKIISGNSKEIFIYKKTSHTNSPSKNLRYKLPAQIILKDGRSFTGYYYEEKEFIYLETPSNTFQFHKSEIESIE
ncbi:MAG: hypothetical protein QXO70_00420 [Candidatus Pacearchaeota archaeon]